MSHNNSEYRLIGDESFYLKEPSEFYNENKDFTTLMAWLKCREVKLFFYKKVLPLLPKEEKFNLDIQIRKASISITSNIAEGYGRYHYQEGIQFYRISRASLFELKDHLLSCYDIGYINFNLKEEGENLIEPAKINLNGYINYINNKIEREK